MFLALPKSKRN